MDLRQLPAELWMHIFSLACTDGGRTGRSLSLVSHHFNELSKSYMLQCVALTTPRQIRLFADLLERSEYKGRDVKSLFIHCPDLSLDHGDDERNNDDIDGESSMFSDSDDEDAERRAMDVSFVLDDGESDYGPTLSSEDQRKFDQELAEHIAERGTDILSMDIIENPIHLTQSSLLDKSTLEKDEEALSNLFRLLTIVAPTLTILSLHWTSLEGYLLEDMIPSLPRLEEFCIIRFITGEDEVEPQTCEAAPLLFPALQRLHIGGYVDERPGSYFKYVSELTPSLSELRCSVPDFAELVNRSQLHQLPPTVTRVIIEMSNTTQANAVITQSRESIESRFSAEKDSSPSRKLEFSYLEHPDDAEEWERQWLSRVGGGCGCW